MVSILAFGAEGPCFEPRRGTTPCDQISAKRGTNLKFEAEANLKDLFPKSKQSSILIYQFRVHMNA